MSAVAVLMLQHVGCIDLTTGLPVLTRSSANGTVKPGQRRLSSMSESVLLR